MYNFKLLSIGIITINYADSFISSNSSYFNNLILIKIFANNNLVNALEFAFIN